jgi:hypothetical protein
MVLPFSQMYPLVCIDIRNFLNKFYFFSDEYFQRQDAIDEGLKIASTPSLLPDYIMLILYIVTG